MVTYSRSEIEPNDWVEYVDANTGELLHVDEFHNPQRVGLPARRYPATTSTSIDIQQTGDA